MSDLLGDFEKIVGRLAVGVRIEDYELLELEYVRSKDALVRHIRNLEMFHRQVTKAAGDLDGLPDGHAFEILSCLGEDGEPEPGTPYITAGMIRRAAAGKEVRHG